MIGWHCRTNIQVRCGAVLCRIATAQAVTSALLARAGPNASTHDDEKTTKSAASPETQRGPTPDHGCRRSVSQRSSRNDGKLSALRPEGSMDMVTQFVVVLMTNVKRVSFIFGATLHPRPPDQFLSTSFFQNNDILGLRG